MYSVGRGHLIAHCAKNFRNTNLSFEGISTSYRFNNGKDYVRDSKGQCRFLFTPAFTGSTSNISAAYHQKAISRVPSGECGRKRYLQIRYMAKSSEQPVEQEKERVRNTSNVDKDEVEADQQSDHIFDDGNDSDMYNNADGLFLTEEEIQELSNGDPEIIKRIKYIQLEYEVFKEEGGQVPSTIKIRDWNEILCLGSRSKRRKYFLHLFKIEMKRQSADRKKETKRAERLQEYSENPLPTREEDIYGMCYALTRNTLFLRLYDTTINRYFNQRACSAMVNHPPLILDCGYDEFMSPRESKNCAKQIELVIAENRTHKEPFNLHLCNAGRSTKTMEYLRRMIPVLDDDNFAVNVNEECFTELFPKKRLVYLTPHTRDELHEYDDDDIYIIGAMVDKTNPRPYSLAKAKKLGVVMRRLPLDEHLMWGMGGKSLTLNQMVRIMLDVRYTRGDWKTALKNVPMRKLNRDFHPYPDQDQNLEHSDSVDDQSSSSPLASFPKRKEKRSVVFEDYELLNRRKGFKRSHWYTPNPNQNRDNMRPPKMRSLFEDDS